MTTGKAKGLHNFWYRPDSREKRLFLRRRLCEITYSACFIRMHVHTGRGREDALENGGRREIVAGVFATSIYRDYSGDRRQIESAINSINRSVQRRRRGRASRRRMLAAGVCTYAHGTNGAAPDSWGWSKYLRLIISSRLINACRYRGVITAASRGTRHFANRDRLSAGTRNWNRARYRSRNPARISATRFDLRSISRRGSSARVNQ